MEDKPYSQSEEGKNIMNQSALIIFIKNPVYGQVKTRLAKQVGNSQALYIYLQLLNHTHQITNNLKQDNFLYYSDYIDENDEWETSGYQKHIQLQSTSDLGLKMQTAFIQVFQSGYDKVGIIGSDCPELSTAIIENAFYQLNHYDFVIGPAKDGGYYFLGMKKMYREIFHNKKWSTESVLEDTIYDIKNLQKSFYLLPTLNDIDEFDDWLDFQKKQGKQ